VSLALVGVSASRETERTCIIIEQLQLASSRGEDQEGDENLTQAKVRQPGSTSPTVAPFLPRSRYPGQRIEAIVIEGSHAGKGELTLGHPPGHGCA